MINENDVIEAYGKEAVDRMSLEQKEYAAEKIAHMKQEEAREQAYKSDRRLAENCRPLRRIRNPINPPKPVTRSAPKIGRNDPCPCGSNKKHKHCCGR